MKALALAAVLLLSACASRAAEVEPLAAPVLAPLKLIGSADWGRDGYFKLKWSKTVEGRCAGLDVARPQREVWLLSSDEYKEDRYRLTALDAGGETARQTLLETRARKFRVWEAGGTLPRAAVMDELGVAAFDAKSGKKLFSYVVPATGPSDIEALGRGGGGPVLVASYGYGDYGLRAVDRAGRLAWQADFIPRSEQLGAARLAEGPALAASDGVGKVFLVSPKGKLLDRVFGKGNMDRVAFSGPARLYGLDSGSGSWTETLTLWSRPPGREGKWSLDKTVDLGPVTATAWTTGRFDGKTAEPRLAVGTDNGWVFLYDEAGGLLTRARFRGAISNLEAADLDGDGREELVVGVSQPYSETVHVFSRPAPVSGR